MFMISGGIARRPLGGCVWCKVDTEGEVPRLGGGGVEGPVARSWEDRRDSMVCWVARAANNAVLSVRRMAQCNEAWSGISLEMD